MADSTDGAGGTASQAASKGPPVADTADTADGGADEWFAPVPLGKEPAEIDTGVAHIARVYNYWLGGADNYAVDREGAEEVIAAFPNIRVSVRAQRAFLGRAVHFLAAEAGITQFLDVGTGLPAANNTHEVAQRVAPLSRIVYVDNDPIVLAHARALLGGTAEGATAFVAADLRDTSEILKAAAGVLDFGAPIAVMLVGILHCIPDRDDPYGLVAQLMAAVPAGSHLVLTHPAKDINTGQVTEATARLNRLMAEEVTMRTHSEVCAFFEGLDLIEPGVVQLHRWRIGAAGQVPDASVELPNYGGVGRKP